ncbi:MAG: hypothetical protein H5T84_03255 [Thermoleophilia bacterium]|nr:hypothetical protein [Thermoleophilia bacterium]
MVPSIATTSSSLPVIENLSGIPMPQYVHPEWVYEKADAVVLGRVVDVLPFRKNPLAGQPEEDPAKEHLPVVYKGYVLSVETAWGPATIPKTITVYTWGTGIFAENGKQYEVRDNLPLDLSTGEQVLVALTKTAYFGTPELKRDEFWAMAPWATFRVDANGRATRATGQEIAKAENVSNEFSLSALESIVVTRGKKTSAIQ